MPWTIVEEVDEREEQNPCDNGEYLRLRHNETYLGVPV